MRLFFTFWYFIKGRLNTKQIEMITAASQEIIRTQSFPPKLKIIRDVRVDVPSVPLFGSAKISERSELTPELCDED